MNIYLVNDFTYVAAEDIPAASKLWALHEIEGGDNPPTLISVDVLAERIRRLKSIQCVAIASFKPGVWRAFR
jgi:hypothetical protein